MAISLFVQCRFSTTLRYSVILLAFLDFRHFPIFHHFLILSDISDIIGYFPNTPHWHYAKVGIIPYFPIFSYIHSDISSYNFTLLDAVCVFSKSDISWHFLTFSYRRSYCSSNNQSYGAAIQTRNSGKRSSTNLCQLFVWETWFGFFE